MKEDNSVLATARLTKAISVVSKRDLVAQELIKQLLRRWWFRVSMVNVSTYDNANLRARLLTLSL